MSFEQISADKDSRLCRLNLTSVAILFIVVVATLIGLVGVALRGTSPWVLIVPLAVGTYAILTIRENN